jgi:hypothetical protein
MSLMFQCHVHGWCSAVVRCGEAKRPCGGCEEARKDAKWAADFEAKYGRRPNDSDRWLFAMRGL